MNFRKWACLFLVVLICLGIISARTGTTAPFSQPHAVPQESPRIEFITAEELKAKLEKGEPVTVLDVRGSSDIANSESKIKGAIHVKLRRLKSRLALPPLNNISRNSEVVLYCACPNDEASIRGAEILLDSGFKRVHALKGGWVAWKKGHGQIESRSRG
jgi:rhodanese-related sulfurtransferase